MSERGHKGPHQYITFVLGHTKFARCFLPRCHHRIHAIEAEGKESLCNKCGKTFRLTRRALRMVRPHCGCLSMRQKAAENILDRISPELDEALDGILDGPIEKL